MLDRFAVIDKWITRESARLAKPRGDIVFYAGWQIQRYYSFVGIVLDRYLSEEAGYNTVSNAVQGMLTGIEGKVTMTPELQGLTHRRIAHQFAIQLWIESFYVFAKILLDKVALFIEYYFADARGLPLKSHDKLTKNFGRFCQDKGLVATPALQNQMEYMRSVISDFRDKWIEHEKSPRTLRGITLGSAHTGVTISHVYPTDRDVTLRTEDPVYLASRIDQYLDLVMEFVSKNGPTKNLAE